MTTYAEYLERDKVKVLNPKLIAPAGAKPPFTFDSRQNYTKPPLDMRFKGKRRKLDDEGNS